MIEATDNRLFDFKVLHGRLEQAVPGGAGHQVQFQRFRGENFGKGQLDKRVNQSELLLSKKQRQVTQQTHLFDAIGSGVGVTPSAGC